MDTCLSFFGKRRDGGAGDDQDPLLPKHASHTVRTEECEGTSVKKGNGASIVDTDGFGPSNGRGSAEIGRSGGASDDTTPHSTFSALEKLVDIVAALKAGKLPSQDQVARFLQVALNSELLRDAPESGSRGAKSFDGTGPTSLKGIKALQDLRSVVQAILEFSVEKNDDNKIQDFVYQLEHLDMSGVKAGSDVDASNLASTTAEAGNRSSSNVKDQVPPTSEVTIDAAILVHALRTLAQSAFASSAFRYLLVDAFGILRDIAVQGASDVEKAASRIQRTAAGVGQDLSSVDMGEAVDSAVQSGSGGIVEKGKEVVGQVVDAAQEAKKQISANGEEWKNRKSAALNEAQDNLIPRIQQVLVRAQEDPSSRRAMRSILILARKYSELLSIAGDVIVSNAEQAAEEVSSAGRSSAPEGAENKRNRSPSYPHPSTLYLPRCGGDSSLPGIHIHTSKQGIDDRLQSVFSGLKEILQRMARGHSLDGLLRELVHVMQDMRELPVELGEIIAHEVDHKGKGKDMGDFEAHETKGKGSRRRKKKGKRGGLESLNPTRSEDHPEKEQRASDTPNVARSYFSRIGRYLDRSLDQPGWIRSRKGTKELEDLFVEGMEILSVVGEAAGDLGEMVIGEQDHEARLSAKGEDRTTEIRRKFGGHIRDLWTEMEAFVAAMEKDRATMKLWQSLNQLADSTSDLFSSSPTSSGLGRKKTSAGILKTIRSSLQWTEWAGWAIPRLIKLIPLDAIPIPTLEARSESGGWQAALYALFVKTDVAIERARRGGAWKGGSNPIIGGVQTTLVPDKVVVKQWSEVQIDMTDDTSYERPPMGPRMHSLTKHSRGRDHHIITERTVIDSHAHREHRLHNARVDTTSRIRMHVDGIRARIDGLGYYFQYGESDAWFGYEDEGVLNVDLGMGRPHAGLGCDIEIEVTSENNTPKPETSRRRKPPLGVSSPSALVGEGLEGEGDMPNIPEIHIEEPGFTVPEISREATIVEGEVGDEAGADGPANLDVQRTIGGTVGREREQEAAKSTGLPFSSFSHHGQHLEPLFKVVDVHVQMRGVHVELKRSRHWILNKLVVQPLAGPTVHHLVKALLEKKIRGNLAEVAIEFAKLRRDASAHGEIRREKTRRRRLEERVRKVENLVLQGHLDIKPDLIDPYDEEEEEGIWEAIDDWSNAIADSASRLLAKKDEGEDNVRVDTGVEATMQGVIIHSSTAAIEETRDVDPHSPPMVFNKQKKRMEPVHNVRGHSMREERATDVSDITVAIGGGAQLFPDKQVPYGERNDAAPSQEGLLERVAGKAREVTDKAKGAATETMTLADQVGTRFEEDLQREKSFGWKSTAFDF